MGDECILSTSVKAGTGSVSGGITVMESSKTGGLVALDCELSSSPSYLSNNREDSTVCLVLMNSVS